MGDFAEMMGLEPIGDIIEREMSGYNYKRISSDGVLYHRAGSNRDLFILGKELIKARQHEIKAVQPLDQPKKMGLIPDGIVKAKHKNPRTMLVYTKPKLGKTTIMTGLKNHLIIDTEDGSDFVDGHIAKVHNFDELRLVAGEIYVKGFNPVTKIYTPPYDYIIIDTLTRIDEWSEIEGTFKYMDKPQGKSFNRIGGVKGGTKILDPNDPNFETVHEIGQGFGYKYSRDTVVNTFMSINTLAPHVIYNCHVKDKYVGSNTSGAEIITREINLTGKLKDIIASKVDTIAYGYREKNEFYLNFADDTGSRSPHLSGRKIKVSEKVADGSIKFFWDEIYLK